MILSGKFHLLPDPQDHSEVYMEETLRFDEVKVQGGRRLQHRLTLRKGVHFLTSSCTRGPRE